MTFNFGTEWQAGLDVGDSGEKTFLAESTDNTKSWVCLWQEREVKVKAEAKARSHRGPRLGLGVWIQFYLLWENSM